MSKTILLYQHKHDYDYVYVYIYVYYYNYYYHFSFTHLLAASGLKDQTPLSDRRWSGAGS
jgi:hypothetical protein